MSKLSKILQACEIFSNLVKKADYSADITDGKRALNNLKSAIEGLDIQSFFNLLIEEDDEYRYLPGYLLGDQYKDCRIQFKYGNEKPRENKFINFEINEQDEFPDPESIKTPIGQAYLQESYDLELRLDINNFTSYRDSVFDRGTISNEFFSFEIEEDADQDEYINDLEQAYLIGLKKAIKKACSVEQPAFYHEMAHLKRMRKQNPKEFIRDWNPSKNPTQPKEWVSADVGSDTELYPTELQQFSTEIANLVRLFNKAQEERNPSWGKMSFLDYLGQEHGMRSKYNFVNSMMGKLFGFGNLPKDFEEIKIPISELLSNQISYLNKIFEIDKDLNHPERDWSVYRNVKKIQNSISNFDNLPPIQIIRRDDKDRIIDGELTLNALNLLSKENPSILNEKIKVKIYYKNSYPNAVVKRIAKFYDDMVAGKFKDTLGI